MKNRQECFLNNLFFLINDKFEYFFQSNIFLFVFLFWFYFRACIYLIIFNRTIRQHFSFGISSEEAKARGCRIQTRLLMVNTQLI